MPHVRAISGTGGKAPACFLVEIADKRLLLDLGHGPIPGHLPDVSGVGRIDAVLLTHGHGDHAGALHLLPQIGDPPVYACATASVRLPDGTAPRPLPLRGRSEILGIPVTTGRNGHAPGGVWLHLEVGAGVLYTGDYATDSPLYAFDPPPRAGTLILDASYGTDDMPLAGRIPPVDAVLDSATGVLMPVPPAGRGPEIALHLAATGRALPAIDDAMRRALAHLLDAGRESVRPAAIPHLARLHAEAPAPDGPAGTILAGDAQCATGTSAALVARWRDDRVPTILFTGFVAPGTPADTLMKSSRARFLRWSVHPRLADNVALVRRCGAHVVVPAFAGPEHLDGWRNAFAPAEVTLARDVVAIT